MRVLVFLWLCSSGVRVKKNLKWVNSPILLTNPPTPRGRFQPQFLATIQIKDCERRVTPLLLQIVPQTIVRSWKSLRGTLHFPPIRFAMASTSTKRLDLSKSMNGSPNFPHALHAAIERDQIDAVDDLLKDWVLRPVGTLQSWEDIILRTLSLVIGHRYQIIVYVFAYSQRQFATFRKLGILQDPLRSTTNQFLGVRGQLQAYLVLSSKDEGPMEAERVSFWRTWGWAAG